MRDAIKIKIERLRLGFMKRLEEDERQIIQKGGGILEAEDELAKIYKAMKHL